MTDLVRALAERLHRANCRHRVYALDTCVDRPLHLDDAREALAFVAERLPTREEIAGLIARRPMQVNTCHCFYRLGPTGSGTNETWFVDDRCQECLARADALLRDWRERLGVKP